MPDISHLISEYGPVGVFAIILFESLGLPLPGETALISAALLASKDHMSISELLLAAWLAAVAGDNIGYAIGRFGGRRVVVRYGSRIGVTEARMIRIERFFARYGSGIVLVARFFAGLRQLNGIVAGIGCMPVLRFTIFNAIGAALWVAVWGLGTYWLGQKFESELERYGPIAYGVVAGGVVALAVFLVWRFVRARKASRSAREP